MGFMDKFKDATQQAQEMAKQAGAAGMDVGDQAAYRDRAMKLNQSGVDTPATVRSIRQTGKTDVGGGKEFEYEVEVRPAGGDAYTTTFSQFMVASVSDQISEGAEITVRVDPDDPSSMLFWGLGS